MTVLTVGLTCAAAIGLLGRLLGRWLLPGPRRQQGYLEVAAGYQRLFRRLGLTEARHFLALPARWPDDGTTDARAASQHIVSGHADRNVAQVLLDTGAGLLPAFLKREHSISWKTRLANALAGVGLLSRSLREARLLQALQRERLGGPEWLAVGEDEEGRGFLLVRAIPDAAELRACLRQDQDPAGRRRLARCLGRTLAALHNAGFAHPDLYANHVLVQQGPAVHLLDWQRSHRRRLLPWSLRSRDLAALHATLDDALASPRERLICLRAYLRASHHCLLAAPLLAARLALPGCWRTAARNIMAGSRRLLRHRHVREKRQAQAPLDRQAWICLPGETLCVTPALAEQCAQGAPDWLKAPLPAGAAEVNRRWLPRPEGGWSLLVQRRQAEAMKRWRRTGRPALPEQNQAALLFRLQRHAVASPRLLAMGQRETQEGLESLLLTQPAEHVCSLEAWLARHNGRELSTEATSRRQAVLHQAGVLLHRLHDASCYLEVDERGCGLAVQLGEGPAEAEPASSLVVLETAETVQPLRRQDPDRARRDLLQIVQMVEFHGGGAPDVRGFLDGYQDTTVPADSGDDGGAGRQLAAGRPSLASVEGIESLPTRPDSLWQRVVRGVRRLRQRSDWPVFAGTDWAERIMDVRVTDHFTYKQGRSTGRWVLSRPPGTRAACAELVVYLKRHYLLPWWQRLLATLWPGAGWSPALQEWENLVWAGCQGIPVPEVVAAGEEIGPWGRLRSFLAVEELTGMIPLSEAVPLAAGRLDPAALRQWKRGLIAEMARVTRLLHDRCCFHKDLYLCHFYVAEDDVREVPACWRGRVHLIDLHRLQHHPWTRWLWLLKDLAQLLYSSEIEGVDVRDRLRFWQEYRATGPRRRRGRWLRRFVFLKWQRYRMHNLRQKARERSRHEGQTGCAA